MTMTALNLLSLVHTNECIHAVLSWEVIIPSFHDSKWDRISSKCRAWFMKTALCLYRVPPLNTSAVEHDRQDKYFLTASRNCVAENPGSIAKDAVLSWQVNPEVKLHHRYRSWRHRIVYMTQKIKNGEVHICNGRRLLWGFVRAAVG